jgi:hypothetical protein
MIVRTNPWERGEAEGGRRGPCKRQGMSIKERVAI